MLVENIFYSLFSSSNFFRIVFPHLKPEYFDETPHITALNKISEYYSKFNKIPLPSDIKLLVEADGSISEKDSNNTYEFINSLTKTEVVTEELLIPQAEDYIQQRAIQNAILKSVDILQKKNSAKGTIEELIRQSLAIQFDTEIGHDYFEDAKARLDSYSEVEETIPLNNLMLNKCLGGGLVKKSLFIYAAAPNKGKSLVLCDNAASLLVDGKNILYISSEMSEKAICRRLDSNVLDLEMKELSNNIDKGKFKSRLKKIFDKSNGRLIVKQYPTGTCNSYHIKALLQELKLKKNFTPDVVILDYINIFASSRLPASAATNSYLWIKSICEEMRAIAVEFDLCVLSAVQNNRGSSKKTTDTGMEDLAESWGIAMTADFVAAIIQNDELRQAGRYLFKTIKTRFDENNDQVYTIGVDYKHMRLFDLAEDEQEIPIHIKDQLKFQANKNKVQEEEQSNIGFDFN